MAVFSRTEAYDKVYFAVMAIENGAQKLNIPAQSMEQRLMKTDLIRKRLFRHYDVLHTQSLEYVTDDIVEALQNREAKL